MISKAQNLVDYMSNNLDVEYKVISNLIGGDDHHNSDDQDNSDDRHNTYRAQLTLRNVGRVAIGEKNWALFFHQPTMISKNDTHLDLFGIKWSHINGDLFRLEPTASFPGLKPGGIIALPLIAYDWFVARNDMLPNWYVTAPGARPRILKCTAGESLHFVANFNNPAKWKRGPKDKYDPFTATERFRHNFVRRQKLRPSVVPTPVHLNVGKATLSVNRDSWVIAADKETMKEAKFLSGKMRLIIIRGVYSLSDNC